jgi:hypothetical protein
LGRPEKEQPLSHNPKAATTAAGHLLQSPIETRTR